MACDTNSECDLIELSVAQKLRQNGVSWGAAGGLLKVVGGGELMPTGSLRLLLTTKSGTPSLTLPRSLLFVCEPEIVENASCDVVIGWPTLRSTGLLDIVLGNEVYTEDLDVIDEEFDMWPPELDKDEYQWPNLIGTAEEKAKMTELSVQYKALFGPPPFGGSNLPSCHAEEKSR